MTKSELRDIIRESIEEYNYNIENESLLVELESFRNELDNFNKLVGIEEGVGDKLKAFRNKLINLAKKVIEKIKHIITVTIPKLIEKIMIKLRYVDSIKVNGIDIVDHSTEEVEYQNKDFFNVLQVYFDKYCLIDKNNKLVFLKFNPKNANEYYLEKFKAKLADTKKEFEHQERFLGSLYDTLVHDKDLSDEDKADLDNIFIALNNTAFAASALNGLWSNISFNEKIHNTNKK